MTHTTNVTTTTTISTGLGYTDRLQFFGQEEGRVRAVFNPASPNTITGLEYDYMIKDHLGNVRMVLTEEVKTDQYPAATMELASQATEELFYSNLSATRIDKPSGYPYDASAPANSKVAIVRGDLDKVGPAILLKVMAGDKFHVQAKGYWSDGTPGTSTDPLSSIVSALIAGAPGASGGKIASGQLTNTLLDPQITSFLDSQPYDDTKPKAYLNWVLFDEQFKLVALNSNAQQIGGSGSLTEFSRANMPIDKNGYLYIYVSNETNNIDVFFDNLQVTHVRGSLLEESHYYPFGLTMAGISSKALQFGEPGNKRGYNGNEIQQREFSDGSGLDVYDFNARTYDQQVGRFIQIDPMGEDGGQESLTPYQFGWNNPVKNADPDGKCPSCLIGAFVGFIVDATIQVGTSIAKSAADGKVPTLKSIWNDYDGKQGFAAAGAGFVTGGISAYEQGTAALAKTVLANVSFSAADQLGKNGKIDPITTMIDAIPAPEVKGNKLINTDAAEKAVTRAENSIGSSTSSVPQRKYNQLNEAQGNLNTQNAVNEGFNSSVTSTRETVGKNAAKAVFTNDRATSPGTVPVTMPRYDTRPTGDNTRVVRPFIPLEPR